MKAFKGNNSLENSYNFFCYNLNSGIHHQRGLEEIKTIHYKMRTFFQLLTAVLPNFFCSFLVF